MRMRLWTIALMVGAVAGAVPPPREDPPVVPRPKPGDVRGRIVPAGRIARVYALCRATGKRYAPARFDPKTGAFVFKDLPGDATYDVGIVTTDGARIEGIDLSWHEARMLRLAEIRRKQLDLPAEPKRTFTREDVQSLLAYVRDLRGFADLRRALYVRGDGLRATMLVEVMRTRPFHARRGDEIIWRMELWYFRYRHGGWERVANVERVLERRRVSAAEWRKITMVYYPRLSAYVDARGRSKRLQFRIPARLDPARGRLAGTEPAQKTEPIVLGVDGAAPPPAR